MTNEQFAEIRAKLGLTHKQLALVLGYGARTRISELECGLRDIPNHIALLMTAYNEGYRPKEGWPA